MTKISSLSDASLRKVAVPGEKERNYSVATIPRLTVRVSPKGKIHFNYRYREGGTARKVSLGGWPQSSVESIKAKVQSLESSGGAPEGQALAEFKTMTFEEAFRKWWNEKEDGRILSARYSLGFAELHLFPVFGRRRINMIGWRELYDWLNEWSKTATVDHPHNYLTRFYSHARLKGWVADNFHPFNALPLSHFKRNPIEVDKKRKRKRHVKVALTPQEIAYVWQGWDVYPKRKPDVPMLHKLIMLTACRNHEARQSHKDRYCRASGTWMLNKEDVKTGRMGTSERGHHRELGELGQKVMDAILEAHPGSKLMFPREDDPNTPRAAQATEFSQLIKFLKENYGVDVRYFTYHDYRRTFETRSKSERLKHNREDRRAAMGHFEEGMGSTYDMGEYLFCPREVYQEWEDFIMRCVEQYPLPARKEGA
ncbi:tyrosine-type recombinase/integrase [Ferrimonas balearica]|uniref:tyrosine-type recombinase/integrase n=1 Tax=Ferrimonas balearica TaxID=44012 RepID=UPI001F1CAEE5|nr:integrase family protein [Ferrimonas balearica]MBY6093796.1 integrase family protein [Ferrimonas balearica]